MKRPLLLLLMTLGQAHSAMRGSDAALISLAENNDCGPGQQYCGGDTCCQLTDTCCPGPGGNGWLCCIDRVQATCCSDGLHCCYRGFECVGNPPTCRPKPNVKWWRLL